MQEAYQEPVNNTIENTIKSMQEGQNSALRSQEDPN